MTSSGRWFGISSDRRWPGTSSEEPGQSTVCTILDYVVQSMRRPGLVIDTDTPGAFAARNDFRSRLPRTVHEHVTASPTTGARPLERDASIRIRELVPGAAGIDTIQFYRAFGDVLGAAERQMLATGQRGHTCQGIPTGIGWRPDVLRTPPME